MNRKLLLVLFLLASPAAMADTLLVSLTCVEESDFNQQTSQHGAMLVDVKSSDDNVGYAVTKYLSKEGDVKQGMTYFKAMTKTQQENNEDFILFTTRQNMADLGKDADFLGLNLKDVGTKDASLYRAVAGRGHDDVSISRTGYFCIENK
ncbi:hypothetical protein [Kluyvera genomosp. 1]|uniref:hypothetical protein n=1 Tax=Kluyvera genomosp. 1 TaxID=2774053 RepID=UPI00068EFAEE|nr:hypothetical protein [Kluyvera genomosp. 1]